MQYGKKLNIWTFFCDSTPFVITQMQLTLFAELSGVAGQAETGEGVDSIQTGGSIQTRVRLALINICRHKTQAYIIPHHSSVSMGSIQFVKKEEEEDCVLVCIYVYLFHNAAQCIQVHTHRHFVPLVCSRSLHSDTHCLSMAGDLHKLHNDMESH